MLQLWSSARYVFPLPDGHRFPVAKYAMLRDEALGRTLQDTLKTVTTKMDEQSAATRKAMADQTLAMNNIGDNVRVLRAATIDTLAELDAGVEPDDRLDLLAIERRHDLGRLGQEVVGEAAHLRHSAQVLSPNLCR